MPDIERILDDFSGVDCRCCKYCGKDCKRFNSRLQPYRNYLMCEQSALQRHMICRDFKASDSHPWIQKHWCGFDAWLVAMKTEKSYMRDFRKLSFYLDGDTDVVYELMIGDFINGNIWREDGMLNYVSVWFYKRINGFTTVVHKDRKEWENE